MSLTDASDQRVSAREVSRALALINKVINLPAPGAYLQIGRNEVQAADNETRVTVRWSAPLSGIEAQGHARPELADFAKLIKEWKSGQVVEVSIDEHGNLHGAGVTIPGTFGPAPEDDDQDCRPASKYQSERILRLTTQAASDDFRPALTGICFDQQAVVATDSYRLAVDYQAIERNISSGFILPAAIISRVASAGGEVLTVSELGDQQAVLRTDSADGGQIIVRLNKVNSQYPDYQQLVPEEHLAQASIDYQQALDQAAKCQRWQSNNQPARLVVDECFQLGGPQVDLLPISEPVDRRPDEPLAIGLNPQFLKQGLEVLAGDSVAIEALSDTRPVLLSGEQRLVVLMPTRLS